MGAFNPNSRSRASVRAPVVVSCGATDHFSPLMSLFHVVSQLFHVVSRCYTLFHVVSHRFTFFSLLMGKTGQLIGDLRFFILLMLEGFVHPEQKLRSVDGLKKKHHKSFHGISSVFILSHAV